MAKTTNADKVISNVYMTFRNYNFGADGRYNSEEHNKKQMQMIYSSISERADTQRRFKITPHRPRHVTNFKTAEATRAEQCR